MTAPGDTDEDAPIASIIDVPRLNRYMSEPQWTPAQEKAVRDIIEGVTDELRGELNAPIVPIPYRETVGILGSGQLDTTYPVYRVTEINGAVIAEDDPLPGGWELSNHRLRYIGAPASPTGLSGLPFTFGDLSRRVDSVGSATVAYLAGWGNVPALRKAILEKSAAIAANRHDETITARDLDSDEPSPLNEKWTEADLKPLEKFRNLVIWR